MKQCSQCKQWKEETEFNKNLSSKDGLNTRCKDCLKAYRQREDVQLRNKEYSRQYYVKNKNTEEYKKKAEAYRERKLELNAKWREENKEHMKEYAKINKERHQETNRILREQKRKYYQEHKQEIEEKYPTKICSKCKQTFLRNAFSTDTSSTDGLGSRCRNCQKEYDRERNKKNLNRAKQYYAEHREDILRKTKERNSIPQFKLNNTISTGIYKSIKQNKAGYHWEDLVPYTLQELKEHLESQFNENMTWGNFGSYWEIDHIIPVNTFDFSSSEDHDFQICWSLANLRPLNWIENRQRPKDGSDISQEVKNNILTHK